MAGSKYVFRRIPQPKQRKRWIGTAAGEPPEPPAARRRVIITHSP